MMITCWEKHADVIKFLTKWLQCHYCVWSCVLWKLC